MAGIIKINSAQFGTDETSSKNLVLTTPTAADGSLTLKRGNAEAPIGSDVLYIGPNGNITLQPSGASITNVTAMNGGPLAGFRNRIINGAMLVAQRNYYSANAQVNAVQGVFTLGGADRMRSSINVNGGTLTSGIIRTYADAPLSIPNGFGATHALIATTTGTSGSVLFTQFIEKANCQDLCNKTVTISAKVYQDTGTTAQAYITLGKPPSSANTFTNSPATIGTSIPVSVPSSVLTTITFTIPLNGTDASLGLAPIVVISFQGAITGKSFAITEFQLEEGPVATAFERRPYQLELALCQRYLYLAQYGFAGALAGATGSNQNIVYLIGRIPPLYSAPTVSAPGTNAFKIYCQGANIDATLTSGTGSTDGTILLTYTLSVAAASGPVGGSAALLTGGGTGWLMFLAEIS